MVSKVLSVSFIVNLILSILKFIGSLLGGSVTLLADSVHCMSDMFTDVISLIGSKLSKKKPDKEHPYGHGRIEYLTSIIMSIFIIVLGITTFISSIKSENKTTNIYAIVILVISIISKFMLSRYLIKKGELLNSNIVKLNGIETRYDTYSSLFALVFVIISFISSKFQFMDALGGGVISILTISVGIKYLLSNISSIIGEVETNQDKIDIISNVVLKNDLVKKIRRITLVKMGTYYKVTIDLYTLGSYTLDEVYKVEKKIKSDLKKLDLSIRYVQVSFKPIKTNIK